MRARVVWPQHHRYTAGINWSFEGKNCHRRTSFKFRLGAAKNHSGPFFTWLELNEVYKIDKTNLWRDVTWRDVSTISGRNELIARYIKLRTNKTRTRKQVTKRFLQIWKLWIRNVIENYSALCLVWNDKILFCMMTSARKYSQSQTKSRKTRSSKNLLTW